MLKNILLAWTIFLSYQICYGQTYGVEPGMLYYKNGDSVACIVEQSVSYGNIIRYKKLGSNTEFKVATSELKAILTPYNFLEPVSLDNKELLMTLLIDGDIKLYNHVTYFSTPPKDFYGRQSTKPLPPTIRYALKSDNVTIEVTKKSFERDIPSLLTSAPHLIKYITEKKLVFEDLETIIGEYNRFVHRQSRARSVTGRVLDPESKKGVNGAAVFISGTNNFVTTNALGYFKTDVLPYDTLQVRHASYHEVHLPSPSTPSFQFTIPKLSKAEQDSVKRFESSLTPKDFRTLVEHNLYYPFLDRRNKREGLILALVKLDTAGNQKTTELVESVGGCGFAVINVLSGIPRSFWRALILKYQSTEFLVPVIFSIDTKKESAFKISRSETVLDAFYVTYRYEELPYDEGTYDERRKFHLYNMKFEEKVD